MPGQVEREHRAPLGEAVEVEAPVLGVAAEAVQEDQHVVALAYGEHAQRARRRLDRLGARAAGVLLGLARHERGLELLDERVDLGVRDLGRRDHAEQAAHRHDVADRRDAPAQNAGRGRLDGAVIFSVSTSAISSPTAISAPSSTSHSVSRPSVIERPHLGIAQLLGSCRRALPGGGPHRVLDPARRPGT